MMIAQQFGIPTINGKTAWFPEGWELIAAGKGQLAEKVKEWAQLKGLSAGVCALDMNRVV